MKILVVASTFPAHDRDSVPAFVRDQIIAMKKVDSSLEFTVLAPHDDRSNTSSFTRHTHYDEHRFHYAWPRRIERLAGRGIMPALQSNPLYFLLIPVLFVGELVALYRLAKRIQPEILYAHWFTPQAIIARVVGRLTGTPFVFTTHASDVSVWHKIPVIGGWVVRSNARRAQAFTAVSRRSMDKLARFFTERDWKELHAKSAVIPMGVDLPENDLKKNSKPQSILFIGRLAEKKGIHYLFPAYAALRERIPDATLTIAGDGPWRARLERQVTDLGLNDHVTFAGYVNGKQKRSLIEDHAVYVVPSIVTDNGDAEGLPVSLMEGLAYGRICVATNESGADDIISDGRDGFLLPQKDEVALTARLEVALSLPDDARLAIQTQAVTTAQQFSWQTVAQRHINHLFKESS